MNIVVLVKQSVFSTRLKITEENKLDETGVRYEFNDVDRYALEEALQIKEMLGGSVTAITAGPERADRLLKECLALGADKAVRIWDTLIEGADSYILSKVLSEAIKPLEYDLELILLEDEIRHTQLGSPEWSRLGWDTWVFSEDRMGEARVIFQPHKGEK